MHGVSGKKISTVLRLQATRTVLPYLDIYTVQRPTINVRQLLCIRPSNQHSFDPRNNVSIALFFSYKVGGLFSVRRPFPSSSETRRGKHASSAPSSACAVYLGHDQSHHQHQHYYHLNNAQSNVGDGGIPSISSLFEVE